MKIKVGKGAVLMAGVLTLRMAFGADALSGALNMGFRDMAVVKQKAEQGDTAAQVILADSLAGSFHATDALGWYRKAAAQGNVEGMYHLGQMLLFGAPGIPANLSVTPVPTEGVRWTFMAATNHHSHAYWNMGKALRQGLGTSQDLIAAYAWLKMFSETVPGSITGKVEMNELALKLETGSLQQAQQLAARFKAGEWKAPTIRSIAEGDPR